ncbi:MAG: hypothetical protein COW34_09730 [Armatimonadetes bacterium CG17_big_fil_post_rev_8_21_14_2_50_66_6]|nr:sigma-70 family RNA polymerase sigma factor [Armatimonadota bacterium]PIW13409.1 MAG: hypothetical protein COW34_09730 [Armatimonadetes bacterium CG17_big_fil_post_rev_8_21_14_2_50_66_6]PJB61004.1 MAG: hypothetical protein CO096_31015 [Armatimonadetes bacterium CG_4_9_14_3_um_filter_66_14]
MQPSRQEKASRMPDQARKIDGYVPDDDGRLLFAPRTDAMRPPGANGAETEHDPPATGEDAVDSAERQWSRELSRMPLLTAAEEIELARRLRRGEAEARRRFIDSNLKLVVSIAKRYRCSGVPMEDLIQEGNIGLIRAVDRFDPERGCRFSTHAIMWIEGQIRRNCPDLKHSVRLPARLLADVNRLGRLTEELTSKFGAKPSVEQLALAMDVPETQVRYLQQLRPETASVNEPVEMEGELLLGDLVEDDNVESPEETAVRTAQRLEVRRALGSLSTREQLVLSMRYGIGVSRVFTLQEIGEQLRLTRQRVRQIETAALKQMRASGLLRGEGASPAFPGAGRDEGSRQRSWQPEALAA